MNILNFEEIKKRAKEIYGEVEIVFNSLKKGKCIIGEFRLKFIKYKYDLVYYLYKENDEYKVFNFEGDLDIYYIFEKIEIIES